MLLGAIVCSFLLGWLLRGPGECSPLPPATRRQLERARKASRAHLTFTAPHVSPPNADFDGEETR